MDEVSYDAFRSKAQLYVAQKLASVTELYHLDRAAGWTLDPKPDAGLFVIQDARGTPLLRTEALEAPYPNSGDVFTVRYLPRFPGDFTILADDDSPWAVTLRCYSLTKTVRQAAQRAVFSHADEDHAAWQAAGRAATTAGCSPGD